jgi:hypothetical protein
MESTEPPAGERRAYAGLALGLRRAWRHVEHRVPGTANFRPYLTHMFPDVTAADAQARTAKLAACLGSSAPPAIEMMPGNVFTVRPV